jgi:microcystin-dependent protein
LYHRLVLFQYFLKYIYFLTIFKILIIMGTESYIATIGIFAGTFAPRNWALCQGQTMAIQQYTALFSLVGTTYGGNGHTTFNLPDLRGRMPVGVGAGPGLPNYSLGQAGGTPNNTLTVANLPAHTHALTGSIVVKTADQKADTHVGKGNPLAKNALDVQDNNRTIEIYSSVPTYNDGNTLGGVTNGNLAVASSGNNQPLSITQPYLALNYCICINGIYPSRN